LNVLVVSNVLFPTLATFVVVSTFVIAPVAPLTEDTPPPPPLITATDRLLLDGAEAKVRVTVLLSVATTSHSTSAHVAASYTTTTTALVPRLWDTAYDVDDPFPTNCEKDDPGGPTHGTPLPDAGKPDAPATYNRPSAAFTHASYKVGEPGRAA